MAPITHMLLRMLVPPPNQLISPFVECVFTESIFAVAAAVLHCRIRLYCIHKTCAFLIREEHICSVPSVVCHKRAPLASCFLVTL